MKYYEGCEEITREKTRDFQAKMKLGYDFKKAYAARRAWEFYNHPEVAGRCYVAVGGLDSITLSCSFAPSGSTCRPRPCPCWRIGVFRGSTRPWE